MTPYASRTRYGAIAQSLHWIMAILVLVAFIFGPGGSEERVYSAAKDSDRTLHETLGFTIFTFAVLRVLWRAIDEHPDPPPIPRWMGLASKLVQGVLYGLLFALPLTAITGAWLEGHPLTLAAGLEVPPLLAKAHDVGAGLARIHKWLGDAILWIAGFHALAALYHHFVRRDGVLVSMLPRWLRIPRPPSRDPFWR